MNRENCVIWLGFISGGFDGQVAKVEASFQNRVSSLVSRDFIFKDLNY